MSRSQRRIERGAQSWRRSSSSTAPWMRVHAYCSSVAPLLRVVAVDRLDQRLEAAGDEVLDLAARRHLADLLVDDVLDQRGEGQDEAVARAAVARVPCTRCQSASAVLGGHAAPRGGRGGHRVRAPCCGRDGLGDGWTYRDVSAAPHPRYWGLDGCPCVHRRIPRSGDRAARSAPRPRTLPAAQSTRKRPTYARDMALRLTDRPLPTASDPTGPSGSRRRPRPRAAREACLGAARPRRLPRALRRGRRELEDVHRRYEARKRAARGRPRAPRGDDVDRDRAGLRRRRAPRRSTILEDEPREPRPPQLRRRRLLRARRARRPPRRCSRPPAASTPTCRTSTRNLDEIAPPPPRRPRQRRRCPPPLAVALQGPRRRAPSASPPRAQPAEGLTLSLCMIVKDEEAMLAALPRRRRATPSTRSSSSTPARPTAPSRSPRRSARRSSHHEWTGDFAAARNVSLRRRDRRLDPLPRRRRGPRRRATARACASSPASTWREAFYLVETNYTGDLEDGTAVTHNALRVFRNRPEYRFEGRLHEQIAHRLPALPARAPRVTPTSASSTSATSASSATSKDKSRRNLELLERQIAEGERPAVPALQPRLRVRRRSARPSRALEQFEQRVGGCAARTRTSRALRLRAVARPAAYVTRAARAPARYDGRRAPRRRGPRAASRASPTSSSSRRSPRATRGDLDRGRAPARAAASRWATRRASYSADGRLPARYLALPGARRAAARRRAASPRPRPRSRRCLAEHPRFLGAVEPLARPLLAAGAEPAEVVAAVARRSSRTDRRRALHARRRALRGRRRPSAEAELRARRRRASPTTAAARVALAEALLSQAPLRRGGRRGRARVEPDVAAAPPPPRAPRCSRALAAGDADAAPSGARRARRRRLPAADARAARRLARRRRRRRAARVAARRAPRRCSSSMLEALAARRGVRRLRAARCPLIETLALPRRERRELLAGVYLRRGFLESRRRRVDRRLRERRPRRRRAARPRPGRRARASMPDDAVVFAAPRSSSSPAHAGAARLLERLAPRRRARSYTWPSASSERSASAASGRRPWVTGAHGGVADHSRRKRR